MSEDDNVKINVFNNEWMISGKSTEEQSLPEKYALGNIVQLHESYREYSHGIIVEQLGFNALGSPHVSLHLFNGGGEIYIMGDEIEGSITPHYVDFAASEFDVVRVAKTR